MKVRCNTLWICHLAATSAIGLALLAGVLTAAPAPSVIGDWQGTATWFSAENGTRQLQVVVHISQGADGALAGTLGFPDMGPETVPLNAITYKQPALHFEFQFGPTGKGKGKGESGPPAKYNGTMNKDNSKITGDVDSVQAKIALVLKRVN